MQIADIMTRGVISLIPTDSLEKAARLMLQYEISGFPVLERGKLVGIVTQGDFLRRAELGTEQRRRRWIQIFIEPSQLADEYRHAHGRTVAEVMTRNVIIVTPEAPLEDAIQLMERYHINRLPVVKDGELVGIISRGNLLHAFIAALRRAETSPVTDAEIERQLAADLDRQAWLPRGSIMLKVENGMVDLEGVISDEHQRAAIRIAAENTPGVKEVRDHLCV